MACAYPSQKQWTKNERTVIKIPVHRTSLPNCEKLWSRETETPFPALSGVTPGIWLVLGTTQPLYRWAGTHHCWLQDFGWQKGNSKPLLFRRGVGTTSCMSLPERIRLPSASWLWRRWRALSLCSSCTPMTPQTCCRSASVTSLTCTWTRQTRGWVHRLSFLLDITASLTVRTRPVFLALSVYCIPACGGSARRRAPSELRGLGKAVGKEPFTHTGLPYQAGRCDPQATRLPVAVEGAPVGSLGEDYSSKSRTWEAWWTRAESCLL